MTTTILAVDDSRTLRKVFEITFAGEPQFKVVVADSAADALGKLHGAAPQVALVDVTLPDQNGYDLCGQIKSQSPSTAVIVLSSKQVPYDQGRGAAAGADDFIDKPFDTQQLIDKVGKLSGGAQPGAAPALELRKPSQVSTPAQVAPKVASAVPRPVPAAAPAPAPASERHIKSVPPPKPKSVSMPGAAPSGAVGGGISAEQLASLGLSAAQVEAVMALSRDVVERVVWEVVPVLAETIIKEEIKRLTAE